MGEHRDKTYAAHRGAACRREILTAYRQTSGGRRESWSKAPRTDAPYRRRRGRCRTTCRATDAVAAAQAQSADEREAEGGAEEADGRVGHALQGMRCGHDREPQAPRDAL